MMRMSLACRSLGPIPIGLRTVQVPSPAQPRLIEDQGSAQSPGVAAMPPSSSGVGLPWSAWSGRSTQPATTRAASHSVCTTPVLSSLVLASSSSSLTWSETAPAIQHSRTKHHPRPRRQLRLLSMGTGPSVEHHVQRGGSQLCASDMENRQMHAARAANVNLTQVPFDYLQVSATLPDTTTSAATARRSSGLCGRTRLVSMRCCDRGAGR